MQILSSKYRQAAYITITILLAVWFLNGYGRKSEYFYGDDLGYYMYLPGSFIQHNLRTQRELPPDSTYKESVRWYHDYTVAGWANEKGIVVNQYTYGVALMEAPFFFVAHAWQHLTGGNANGYSPPYEYALKICDIVYAFLGLMLVYKVLRCHYGQEVSLLATIILFIGTNLFWFTLHQAGMAHVPLFFLYAVLLWQTVRLHESPRWSRFAAMGFVIGLITLIRPTDLLCIFIPLFYGVTGRESAKGKLQFIRANAWKFLPLVLAFILPIIPQLLYWKMLTGDYVYYSYKDQGFNWAHPEIIAGLIEGQNGWLAYSPVMLFSIAGLLWFRKYRAWALPLAILFPLYVYVVYSWYCFNYINGLGSRPMIHIYPLLALPLAASIQWLGKKNKLLIAAGTASMLFFIAVNISFSMQQSLGILLSSESHGYYNRNILFRTKIGYEDLVVRDISARQPRSSELGSAIPLSCLDCCPPGDTHTVVDSGKNPACYLRMKDEEYLPTVIKVVYTPELKRQKIQWIKFSGYFLATDWPGYYKHRIWLSFRHPGEPEIYHDKFCTVNNKIGVADSSCEHARNGLKLEHYEQNRWGTVFAYVPTPKNLRVGDTITLNIINSDRKELRVAQLCLEAYSRK
jgi:hypothetical protein